MKQASLLAMAFAIGLGAVTALSAQESSQVRQFNTVKQKLAAGERVVGGTVSTADPEIYCSMANAGFDFTWIEMQHSALSYSDVARMIWACRALLRSHLSAYLMQPRVTSKKATDIGALGIIIPMVDNVEKIRNAVTYAKYPLKGNAARVEANTVRFGAEAIGALRMTTS